MQPGVTLRDLVHAIPYYAIKQAFGRFRAHAGVLGESTGDCVPWFGVQWKTLNPKPRKKPQTGEPLKGAQLRPR